MPLDPDIAAHLSALPAGAIDLSVVDAATFRKTSNAPYEDYRPREAVASVVDRTIPGPAGDIPVRIYTPAGIAPFGILVYFHGSGFVLFNLDSHDHECRVLANLGGVVVVSVDYRLAPEHPYPAAVDDCWAALEWTHEHASELRGDSARLGVGGDSAGGNLAAVTAQMARDRGVALAWQLLVYPVTDLHDEHPSRIENGAGFLLTREIMQWFEAQYVRDAADRLDPRVSPLRASSFAGLAPALVITAGFDPLRDEGEAYARALRDAGVEVTLSCYEGAVHGTFQLSDLTDAGRRMLNEAGAAAAAALGRPSA